MDMKLYIVNFFLVQIIMSYSKKTSNLTIFTILTTELTNF